jgi:hypothetical protein
MSEKRNVELLGVQTSLMERLCRPAPRTVQDELSERFHKPQNIALLARLAHSKRMEKIERVLPVVRQILGTDNWLVLSLGFARSEPPQAGSTISAAEQYCRFLHYVRHPIVDSKPYIVDLAACELAIAQVSQKAHDDHGGMQRRPHDVDDVNVGSVFVCRHPSVALLRLRYNVVPLLAATGAEAGWPPLFETAPSHTYLAIVGTAGSTGAELIKLDEEIFEFLSMLDSWYHIDLAPGSPMVPLLHMLSSQHLVVVSFTNECPPDLT